MRSALYYPNTELDESLLKSSLLLWDEVHVIVPWPGFEPSYESRDARDAFSLIGKCRCPSDKEKARVHELVEDFVSRPLPKAFTYRSTASVIHGVYPQKLLPDTWEVLCRARPPRSARRLERARNDCRRLQPGIRTVRHLQPCTAR